MVFIIRTEVFILDNRTSYSLASHRLINYGIEWYIELGIYHLYRRVFVTNREISSGKFSARFVISWLHVVLLVCRQALIFFPTCCFSLGARFPSPSPCILARVSYAPG